MEPCNQIDRDLGGERRKLNFAARGAAPWPLTFQPNTLWIHLFNLHGPDKRGLSVHPSKNLLEHGREERGGGGGLVLKIYQALFHLKGPSRIFAKPL